MTMITTYRLRAANAETLHVMLLAASEGLARPYAFTGEDGEMLFDEARVRLPFAEMVEGAPVEMEGGDGSTSLITPLAETGFWLCEVMLAGEEDANLAALTI